VKENTVAAVSADAIHLIATGLWAGGLPFLFWAIHAGTGRLGLPLRWVAETVVRFSRLALVSVAVIIVSGLYQSLVHVQNLRVLFVTPYGNVYVLKILLFLIMAGLGAYNFLSIRPRLREAREDNLPIRRKALRSIGIEWLMGFLVLGVTGFLTVLPPGAHSLHLARGRPGEEKTAGSGGVLAKSRTESGLGGLLDRLGDFLLTSSPKLAPAEGAKVTILSPKPGMTLTGDDVPLRYEFIRGRRGRHLHVYVDGDLMRMFSHPETGTLMGIPPGEHTLEIRVVAEDHATELDATDNVRFRVKGGATGEDVRKMKLIR
jgi:uncharacterized membrane protein